MIILNYLLSISLIVTTIIKTTELFIGSDKALVKIQEQFIQDTKKLHKNQKGSVSLLAISLITMISCLLLFYVTKMKLEYRESVYRSQSYLCFHYLNTETEKYISEMAKFNIAIRAAFLAQKTVASGISAVVIFKGLVIARNTRHFLFVKKIMSNKYCHFPETISFVENSPFKTKNKLLLETNIDETSRLRTTKWTNSLYLNPKGIRLKKSFCLQSLFQVQNAFFPNTKYSTSEQALEDLSNLKCFYGSSS